MNLRAAILKEHSKAQCNAIVQWIGDKQERFDELFALFLNDEYRVTQRAAWPLSYAAAAHPVFIKKHFTKLVNHLQQPGLHNAVKRNTVRLLQHIDIPAKQQGPLMNICFDYVASPTEPVAVKVFSMTILANLAKKFPDIIPEIKTLIEDQLENATAGFKSRANKILKQFQYKE